MTAVSISQTPILQFFGNNGQMLAGGSVLTQVGGVNYPTYQDSAGTIPLPNPIPLNSRGEISNASGVSSQLYLASGVIYTLTIKDALGNTINTVTGSSAIAWGNLTGAPTTCAGYGLVGSDLVSTIGALFVTNATTSKNVSGGGTVAATTIVAATDFSGPTLGVVNGSNAAAGMVGEYISSSIGTNPALTTNVANGITSISLTAGDWDVSAIAVFGFDATTSVTTLSVGVGSSVSFPSYINGTTDTRAAYVPGLGANISIPTRPIRVSVVTTTTIYLNVAAVFTVSTMSCNGMISARRMR
jgi:hypothetical protein